MIFPLQKFLPYVINEHKHKTSSTLKQKILFLSVKYRSDKNFKRNKKSILRQNIL